MSEAVAAGTVDQLHADGHLLTKVGQLPVVVFDDGGELFAIEDRCPHMGFPLHRGTVECGLVTCHWHHAWFDLAVWAARSTRGPTTRGGSTCTSRTVPCSCLPGPTTSEHASNSVCGKGSRTISRS